MAAQPLAVNMADPEVARNLESHAVILLKLEELKTDLGEVLTLARATNGRVNKHDSTLAVLRYAVFGGGVSALGAIGVALWYLIQMHLR